MEMSRCWRNLSFPYLSPSSPPPGHPVSLETTLTCADLRPAMCKTPHGGDSEQLILCACRDHSQTPSCLGCSRPCSENKAAAWRQFWLLMFRECHRQPGNEPLCNPTSGSCIYIDPWKQFSSLAHHSHHNSFQTNIPCSPVPSLLGFQQLLSLPG